MKILMVASEAAPFAKTGGLGDMVPALSLTLSKLGHQVRILMPRYYCIDAKRLEKIPASLNVPLGGGEEGCAVYSTTLPHSPNNNPVLVYFIEHHRFFGRDGVYGNSSEPDFLDNPQRFTFLSRSAFELCRKLDWFPDIIHSHDWPTALTAVFLKYLEKSKEEFSKTASVLTIHNLGYQGIYSKDNFHATKLDWEVFYNAGFDDWNMMNLLKAGIYSADKLNTVSSTYARETRTGAQGFRLDGALRSRGDNYIGILNGIDTENWNPRTDPFIPQKYSEKNMTEGKKSAKEKLQAAFNVPVEPDIPLISMVTRLTDQKGVGELFGPMYGSAFKICNEMNLQFIVLGTGESWCEHELRSLSSKLPNFKAMIKYDEGLSHLIYAGSDFLLMPSRYEPSGLNQMYALSYGTPPIVRNTGGLADTVENFSEQTGEGTGFMFNDLTPEAIYDTVGWANYAYYNKKDYLKTMRLRGMRQDFSWERSAKKYLAMYENALKF